MIYKEHLIEIWVNGKKLELESQDSVNIRFNNTLFDPTKITSTQSEYSFEFEIPCTPNNNRIFDYANVLSKLNKFHQRYTAEVYADGTLIFTGSLIINKCHEGMYNVNLVSIKNKSIEEIFGDSTMNTIDWKIPFDGVDTINAINSGMSEDYCFPLVSYGVFQKSPKSSEYDIKEYTSKFDFDEYNRWYLEDFYPSPKVMTTLKKAFENKGYTVGGDAFIDQTLNSIYMSTNLADEQSPTYNVGNPHLGKVELDVSFTTTGKTGYMQELKYPYYVIDGYIDMTYGDFTNVSEEYNFTQVELYDMLEDGNVTVNEKTYMYQPDEHIIVIPADGFYKIELSASTTLLTSAGTINAAQWVREWNDDIGRLGLKHEKKDISFEPNLLTTTPVEIQLVKNYDDNIELIKGQYNLQIIDGYPDHTTQGGPDHPERSNYSKFYTCFPHEKLGSQYFWFPVPTKGGDLISGNASRFYTNDCMFGYVPNNSPVMAYDPAVSDAFICGFSSMGVPGLGGCGTIGVMKNGYSWSNTYSARHDGFYRTRYSKCDWASGGSTDWVFTPSDYQSNDYYNTPSIGGTWSNFSMNCTFYCCLKLKKNDRLQLFTVHRGYEDSYGSSVHYQSATDARLMIEAITPESYEMLKARKDENQFDYNTPTEFDVDLQLGNFFNKEKKISDWVQNVFDAFNLESLQYGDTITISKTKKLNNGIITAVDIDDRVNKADAESSLIEYPRSMAVKFKIDKDEWGFERSAVEAAGGDESILDYDGWERYADSGYTPIQLNDDTYVTNTSEKNLQFSYNWYDTFHWYDVDSAFTKVSDVSEDVKIPVISKFSYMIDGYDYEESMKHDGYGLAQRFWFTPQATSQYVWTRTAPAEQVWIYTPTRLSNNGLNISYKNTEKSILTEYFNVNAFLASNYVELDVYLSSEEYNRIKNGVLVKFDSDLYYPVELSGYDPSGNDITQLKIMKKVD